MHARSKSAAGVAGILAGLGLAGVHWHVLPRGMDYSGPLGILDHFFDIALAASVLAICAGVGRTALRRFDSFFDQALESLLFSVAIGAGIVATTVLALGALGGLRPHLLVLLFAGHVFVARQGIRTLPSLVMRVFSEIKDNATVFDICLFSLFAVFMLAQALLPPMEWDALMYHLEVPRQFLQKGRIHLPMDSFYACYIQLVHMLYLPLLAWGSDSGPAILNAFFAAGLGLAVFSFCLRFADASTASRCLSLLWGSPVLISVAVTPMIDVTVAFYLFLAQHALLRALREDGTRPLFKISAVLLGLAVGAKLTAAVYGLALAPLIVLASRRCCPDTRAAAKSLMIFSVTALLAALPWLFKNWILLRAPLFPYPYTTKPFIEPWLASYYAAQHTQPAYNILSLDRLWPRSGNPLDMLFAPRHIYTGGNSAHWSLNSICLFLPLWLLFLDVSLLNWLVIPAFLYVALFFYILHLPEIRYLAPIVAPLTIASVVIAQRSLSSILTQQKINRLLGICTILVLLPSIGLMQKLLSKTAALSYWSGRISRRQCLMANRQNESGNEGLMQMTSYINRELPKQSHILMLFEARSYYFKVPVLQDNRNLNWMLLSQLPSAYDCLRSTGITHVLINHGDLQWNIDRGIDARSPYLRLEALSQFVAGHLVPEYQELGYSLYRLK